MEFLVYSRATPSAVNSEDDPALNEEHWSYMDRFADRMTARGPTLAADRVTPTGSLHIVDLPSFEAAHEFAEREPYNRAGLFEHHLIRRFNNLLGRTMWEFPGGAEDPRFVVIVHAHVDSASLPDFTRLPRERLIVHGELLAPDEARPVGVALALQASTRQALDTLLRDGRAGLDRHFDTQTHDWEFGGRR
jgi:uncharacterized protein